MKRSVIVVVVTVALIGGAAYALSRRGELFTPGPHRQLGPAASDEPWLDRSCTLPLEELERVERGTVIGRSGDVTYVPRFPHYFGSFSVSTHSGSWDYLQEVPLLLYGPGHVRATGDLTLERPTTLADLAPTLAEVLGTSLSGERDGTAITEALLPADRRTEPPRLVVLVVWDGAGWNVLEEWPNAWPFLAELMTAGTSIQDVSVGSSPSVTPAIHSTMGTGVFPRTHGITDIPLRMGRRVPDAFPDKSPKFLETPTLADEFDASTGNRSKVGIVAERGWHLGMMGHGAYLDGGDRDIAVMSQGGDGELTTNGLYYRLPEYLQSVPGFADDIATVDAADGKRDGIWMGHRIPSEQEAGPANPVWTRFQRRLLEALVTREGFGADSTPDLLFTNFKEIDVVGHVYNMVEPEMRSVLRHADDSLERFVSFLDREVGKERWVLAFTADHGSGPDPPTIGAWPIDMPQLQIDLATHLGVRVTNLFQAQRPTGMWFHPSTMDARSIDLGGVADFLLDYRIRDNLAPGTQLPASYAGRGNERLFAAAFPTSALPDVMACARERA